MASSGDHFKSSDVTFWGIVALGLGAVAVLGGNLSAVVPPHLLTGLHSTRLDGGNLNHLRAEVSQLRDETSRMRNENGRLLTMLTLAEQDQGDVTRRIGAIESSLPTLIEENALKVNIDRASITSGIGGKTAELMEADGGMIAVTTQPLEGGSPQTTAPEESEMPAIPQTAATAPQSRVSAPPPDKFGIALGPRVSIRDAFVAWQDITNKVGPLLLGLGPILSGDDTMAQRLVAGPLDQFSEAEQLCSRMRRVGITCLPVPYEGDPLPE